MKIDQQQIRTYGDFKVLFVKKEEVQKDEEQTIQTNTRDEQSSIRKKEITKSLSEALNFFTSYSNNNYAKKSEKFETVWNEFIANVPDRTTTIEEKENAISYIERMLSCDDITPELKNYWTNKKDIIEMEIQNIKNRENTGNNESINDVANEWQEFTDKYWNKTPEFDNTADRVEYYRSYYNMYISFCDRALACSDITEESRSEWTRMKNNALFDLNNHNRDLNRYDKENNIETESFKDVYKEFERNVPDSTTTVPEKKLAISYIERMLSCDDIPNSFRIYWQNKEASIKNELRQFN